MPQGADVRDVAEEAGLDQLGRVCVEQAVVPLMADREDAVVLLGDLDHLLALADGPGHELLAQSTMLAGLHALDRHLRHADAAATR